MDILKLAERPSPNHIPKKYGLIGVSFFGNSIPVLYPLQRSLICGGEFKKSLAEVVINYLEPFRRKQKELQTRDVYVKELLNKGKSRAETIAKTTMQEVREKMGLG